MKEEHWLVKGIRIRASGAAQHDFREEMRQMKIKSITTILSVTFVMAMVLSGCSTQSSAKVNVPAERTPAEVVDSFYRWYIDYAGNPLADGAYRSNEHLTEAFVTRVDEIIAAFDKGGYDPFLCAQDIPGSFSIGEATVSGEKAAVSLIEVWNPDTEYESTNHVGVALQLEGETWKIANVTCGGSAQDTAEPISPMPEGPVGATPEGTIDAFYSWYLWYVREVGNPLVDGAYRSSEYVSTGLVQKVDAILASFDKGGFDPFLCAQDIPESITVEDAVISGDIARSVVRTSFQGHGFTVSLQRIDGRWEIGDILCEIEQAGEGDGATGSARINGWQVFADDQYGFRIEYPSDWVPQEVEPRYPELDAPTVRIVQFLPQEWAQRMNTGGPPDPNNTVVAPLGVEVSVGTLEAYQAKYPTPASSEIVEINGYTVAREREVADDFSMIRYVFQHPTDGDLRVTLIDQISGFSTRVEGNKDVADTLQQILGTFSFNN